MSENKPYKGSGQAPRTRNASGIIADLQENAAPLDKPIRFGRKIVRRGRIERTGNGTKFVSTQEYTYNKRGEPVPKSDKKLTMWNGKYHRVHEDICG